MILAAVPPPADDSALMQTLIYVVCLLVGLTGSATFSGIETAVYTVSRLRLILNAGRGDRRAAILQQELDRPSHLLGTLLLGNNVMNFLASFGVAGLLTEAMGLGVWGSIAVQTTILTPLIFICGEAVPKELSRANSEAVGYRTAALLRLIRRLFTAVGLLPVIILYSRAVDRLLGSGSHTTVTSERRRISSLMREGLGPGVVTVAQTEIVDRVLGRQRRVAGDHMVPWPRVQTVSHTETPADFRRRVAAPAHARFPVVDQQTGAVVGVVSLIEWLARDDNAPPTAVMRRPVILAPATGTLTALRTLRESGQQLAVIGSAAQPLGVVAVKDLVEPLLGELAAA